MNNTIVKSKQNRINIERAIYQNIYGDKEFTVIGYSKKTKKVATLGKFDNLQDAKVYRDTNIRFAKYGKGIEKLQNGKFKTYITIYSKFKKRGKNSIVNFYIGVFDSAKEATEARLHVIESLK